MNNRHEIAYRLQRDGFDEIQVGWERVYDLTPGALREIVSEKSFVYDKPLSISFPEWWKNDKEAKLPSVILNNVFGIIPDFDYNKNFTGIRLVNLATNEEVESFPGDEQHLLYICKHILTYCKKLLRSWGKEPYKEFRYGMEYLRDKWHMGNYPDTFQRPDVRIYEVLKYNRLTPDEYFIKAYKSIQSRRKENSFSNDANSEIVYECISGKTLENLMRHFQDNKPADFDVEIDDLRKWFWFLPDKEIIVSVYERLADMTNYDYNIWTYIDVIADAIVPRLSRPQR